ncbi:MmcQ/YjbR family DNA-binding protein [Acetivibrio cellulolyticus]|uniref:hypothetical protein n=1 Tax=Acetivibrio cellulolyticus TaxID=35830 RepID=UPI0001E2CBF7|nr:hypothetical protein [Acetivibrio cellulolyticus]
MKYTWLEEYCLSKKGVVKEYKPEWDATRYMIKDKIFVLQGGPNAVLMVSSAFLIQTQAAAWFIKANRRLTLFSAKDQSVNAKEGIWI